MSQVKLINIAEIHDHPTLERLGIVEVDGLLVVVKKEEFKVGDPAIYIPIDCVVSDRPEFSFLDSKLIEPKDFGDVQSQGLVIPVPPDYKWEGEPATFLRIQE